MLYIVLTACLVSSPEECGERYIPVYADVSLMACMMGAQAEIALWKETHAELNVSRWQCKAGETIAAAAAPRDLAARPARIGLK